MHQLLVRFVFHLKHNCSSFSGANQNNQINKCKSLEEQGENQFQ